MSLVRKNNSDISSIPTLNLIGSEKVNGNNS